MFSAELKVSNDLQHERNKCNFNVEELTNYIDGGVFYTTHRRKIENKVLTVKGLFDDVPEEYLSYKAKYENAVRKAVLLYRILQEIEDPNLSINDKTRLYFRNTVTSAVFKDVSPFLMHFGMFIQVINGQADDEQKAYWIRRAKNMEILGTYAQTELGHGTFIRGLETTATYDARTEEFVLHTPTLTAYKWWPGSLGHTVNYCVVMAHLYIEGQSCGIQPFIVQIRDEDTHIPLPGIQIGEIGAKMVFNTANNGFLGFKHHRIPRENMLMKNAQVSKDGKFKLIYNSKLTYGTMVFVRVTIVNAVANHLAKAVTIAVRYSAVRRQGQKNPSEPEVQILDYVTQQDKLFIGIATSHVFSIIALWLWDKYCEVTEDLTARNMERLPELHALACCLKSVSSSDATSLIEQCRLACGGHGYMLSSNLPQLYGLAVATCTYEGENTVLMLQTARFLLKEWKKSKSGIRGTSSTSYFMKDHSLKQWDSSIDGIIRSFQTVAYCKIRSCAENMEKYSNDGVPYEDAWNMTSIQLVSASEAHCRAIILSTLKSEVDRTSSLLSISVKKVIYQLVHLYTTYWALKKIADFLLYTAISEADVHALQSVYDNLLSEIRPNCVGLVDAFDIRDEILHSALGAYDGRVYERLMTEALKSPLNQEPVNKSFHQYLKPFMRGKL